MQREDDVRMQTASQHQRSAFIRRYFLHLQCISTSNQQLRSMLLALVKHAAPDAHKDVVQYKLTDEPRPGQPDFSSRDRATCTS